ncbi:MAG: putative nitroreductase YfkO [Candidatus Parcubacteria bacterium]|jgi:nitroreductase
MVCSRSAFVVVADESKKQALVEHAYGQTQVAQNGALVVLAARTDVDAAYITEYTNRIEAIRHLPAGTVNGFKDMMVGHLTNISETDRLIWAQKQAYIALGTMMTAASERRIDNAALEGFNADKFDEILGLSAHHLRATALLVLGYRSADDATAAYVKVRKNMADIVVHI